MPEHTKDHTTSSSCTSIGTESGRQEVHSYESVHRSTALLKVQLAEARHQESQEVMQSGAQCNSLIFPQAIGLVLKKLRKVQQDKSSRR